MGSSRLSLVPPSFVFQTSGPRSLLSLSSSNQHTPAIAVYSARQLTSPKHLANASQAPSSHSTSELSATNTETSKFGYTTQLLSLSRALCIGRPRGSADLHPTAARCRPIAHHYRCALVPCCHDNPPRVARPRHPPSAPPGALCTQLDFRAQRARAHAKWVPEGRDTRATESEVDAVVEHLMVHRVPCWRGSWKTWAKGCVARSSDILEVSPSRRARAIRVGGGRPARDHATRYQLARHLASAIEPDRNLVCACIQYCKSLIYVYPPSHFSI
ncbi:hypothetical protein B0H17DRAFT_1150947 [Mycena rosella]|uniref:Uncharacterized protein n=1 Tax=Mycena rosella TaxID=1033263 RepID=A0AAD7FIQ4_MYCRO|nr:hypothetical protein B0H17DRAFT_1150947 [Mycena rosella]